MQTETTSVTVNPFGCLTTVLGIAAMLLLCKHWDAINAAVAAWLAG